jgi:hypothetical protein
MDTANEIEATQHDDTQDWTTPPKRASFVLPPVQLDVQPDILDPACPALSIQTKNFTDL